MTSQFKHPLDNLSVMHQGSRALDAQAEKVLLPVGIAWFGAKHGWPPNLPVLRLGESSPTPVWVRQPPNLANQNAHTCTRTRTYTRAHWLLFGLHHPVKLKSRLGRLGGWQGHTGVGLLSSNLSANLFEVGQTREGKRYGR